MNNNWIKFDTNEYILIIDERTKVHLYEQEDTYKIWIYIQTLNSERLDVSLYVKKDIGLERAKEIAYKSLYLRVKKRLLDYKKIVFEYEELLHKVEEVKELWNLF